MKKTAALLLALILTISVCLCGCEPGYNSRQKTVTSTGFFFNTVVTITLYNAAQSAADDVLAQCGEYERLLSKFTEGSDIWNINHANGVPVTVDRKTARLLETAKRVCELSQGAFDITIEPVMALWSFDAQDFAPPSETALAEAVSRVSYAALRQNGDVAYLPGSMSVDLGGIAKGFAADELADYCRARELYDGIINIGGNLLVMGSKPNKEAYRVGVQDPAAPSGEYTALINGVKGAVASSGGYQSFAEKDGVRYHHLINPKTGMPAQSELASVTVLTDMAVLADAFAAAAFVLGPDDGRAFLQSFKDTEAVFVYNDGHIEYTDGLEGRITKKSE